MSKSNRGPYAINDAATAAGAVRGVHVAREAIHQREQAVAQQRANEPAVAEAAIREAHAAVAAGAKISGV